MSKNFDVPQRVGVASESEYERKYEEVKKGNESVKVIRLSLDSL